MDLRDSPLWNEVEAIALNQKLLPPYYSWKADFKLSNKKTVTAFKVISLLIHNDYKNAYASEIILEVMIPAGDFVYDIYPKRRNIEILLRKEGRAREIDASIGQPIEGQTYIGTLMGDYSAAVESSTVSARSKEAMNLEDFITVKFQLLGKALKDIRLRTVGGLFKDTTIGDILRYVLTTVSNGLQLDEVDSILGVDMADPSNTDTYSNVVIPHGTRFPDFPVYLTKNIGGLYNAGMGLFLYNQHWYVYPLYDLTRFDKSKKTLTLINLPPKQMPGAEITYRTTANQTIVLVTGEVKHTDQTESTLQNGGNGVRYLDARKVVDGFSSSGNGDNKSSVLRADNNNEFISEVRNDGMNNVATSSARVTANKFEELTKLARRAGTELTCKWENSDINAVYPGMPVKFLYLKNNEVRELKGIVLGAEHYVQTRGVGVTDSRHITETTLHLFVTRETED